MDVDTVMDNAISNEEVEIFRRTEWSNIMTKLLISLYKQLAPKVGKNKEISTCTKLYERIAEIMSAKGYALTPMQIKQKWDSLSRSYKDAVMGRQGVRRHKTCVYQKELYDIFKTRIKPEPDIVVEETQIVPKLEIPESVPVIVAEPEDDIEIEDHSEAGIDKKSRISLSSMLTIFTKQCDRHHTDKMLLLKKMMKQKKVIAEQRRKDRKELLDILQQKSLSQCHSHDN